MTSISETPEGVEDSRGSENCHTPSCLRVAIRIFEPGICSISNPKFSCKAYDGLRNVLNRGASDPNGVICTAG